MPTNDATILYKQGIYLHILILPIHKIDIIKGLNESYLTGHTPICITIFSP